MFYAFRKYRVIKELEILQYLFTKKAEVQNFIKVTRFSTYLSKAHSSQITKDRKKSKNKQNSKNKCPRRGVDGIAACKAKQVVPRFDFQYHYTIAAA